MHPTKLQRLDNGLYPVCDLYNCKGASEINDKADVGLTVWRNKDEEYAELHVTKMKFRNLGKNGHATFKFNVNNGRYVEIGDVEDLKRQGINIPMMQVKWDNENYITNKVKNKQIQTNLDVEVEEQPTESFNPFSSALSNDDCPF